MWLIRLMLGSVGINQRQFLKRAEQRGFGRSSDRAVIHRALSHSDSRYRETKLCHLSSMQQQHHAGKVTGVSTASASETCYSMRDAIPLFFTEWT